MGAARHRDQNEAAPGGMMGTQMIGTLMIGALLVTIVLHAWEWC